MQSSGAHAHFSGAHVHNISAHGDVHFKGADAHFLCSKSSSTSIATRASHLMSQSTVFKWNQCEKSNITGCRLQQRFAVGNHAGDLDTFIENTGIYKSNFSRYAISLLILWSRASDTLLIGDRIDIGR